MTERHLQVKHYLVTGSTLPATSPQLEGGDGHREEK